jgi:hypothetical protein
MYSVFLTYVPLYIENMFENSSEFGSFCLILMSSNLGSSYPKDASYQSKKEVEW